MQCHLDIKSYPMNIYLAVVMSPVYWVIPCEYLLSWCNTTSVLGNTPLFWCNTTCTLHHTPWIWCNTRLIWYNMRLIWCNVSFGKFWHVLLAEVMHTWKVPDYSRWQCHMLFLVTPFCINTKRHLVSADRSTLTTTWCRPGPDLSTTCRGRNSTGHARTQHLIRLDIAEPDSHFTLVSGMWVVLIYL